MSEGCRLCSGQGSFGAFGACNAADMHRRGPCPCCQGTTRTNYNVACPPCQGKGGVGAFGPCLPFDTHYKGACRACEGRGYHFPGTTFTPCAPCQGKGGVGTFGPCAPNDVHFKSLCAGCGGKGVIIGQAYVPQPVPQYAPVPQPYPQPGYPQPVPVQPYPQPVPVQPYPQPVVYPGQPTAQMGFPGVSVSVPGMSISMPGMGMGVNVVMPTPVPVVATIDQVVHVQRHAHDLHYSGHITGKICDICRVRLGSGYQCSPCKFDLCMNCFNNFRNQGQVTIPGSHSHHHHAPVVQDLKVDGLVHMSGVGDVSFSDSNFGGSKGRAAKLEGFQLSLRPHSHDVNIEYMCHAANVGDMPWVSNGSFQGSRGQSRQIEGIAVRLTGGSSHLYNVRYMVHMAGKGDSSWVSNGAYCGSKGESRAIEGIHVIVDRK